MMYYIFIFIYFACLSYVMFKKRSIDLYTILFGGLFYYSLPLILGKISLEGVVLNQFINYKVYLVYSFAFILSFIFMFKGDVKKLNFVGVKDKREISKYTSKIISYLSAFIFFMFLVGVYQFGFSDYLSTNKSVNEENMVLIQLSVVLAMIVMPVSLYYRKLVPLGIFFVILFSFLLYGARSYFVVAAISSVFILFQFKKIQLIKKIPWFLLGGLFAVGMAIFKNIYSVIKFASLEQIVSIVINLEYDLVLSQLLADPMAVIYNLNYTINNEVNLSFGYFFHRIFSIIPGGGNIFESFLGKDYPRYSSILAGYYTDVHWGLASSLYAEIIAISGYVGFIVVYFFMNRLVSNYNTNIQSKGFTFNNLIFISSFTYLLFYSHRLDITFVLGIFKFCIIIWILFKYGYKTRKKNKKKNEKF